jgi:hypothetical protein
MGEDRAVLQVALVQSGGTAGSVSGEGHVFRGLTSPVAVVTRTGRLYADAGRYPPLPASFSIATRTRPAGMPSPAVKSRSCSSRAANVVRSSSRKSDMRR